MIGFQKNNLNERKIKRENSCRENWNPILANCELIKYRKYHTGRRWVNVAGQEV